MNNSIRIIRRAGKKICNKLFPRQMELRRIRLEKKAWEERERWFNSLHEEDYPEEVAKMYLKSTGHELHLDNPRRFTEKIQWRKLYDRNPIYSKLTDKYAVREWIEKKIGSEYLIPLLGVWESFDQIDFDSLPDSFVLKTNNASGTNIIVRDKNKFDKKLAEKQIEAWLSIPFSKRFFELHYGDIKPLIIAEAFITPPDGENDLPDYKFMCFHGKPYYCWIDVDRYHGHKRKVFDLEWNEVPWNFGAYAAVGKKVQKPQNFELMVQLAEKLCAGFEHVRVDMYNLSNTVYFGEMTFTSESGLTNFHPDEMDYALGSMWDLTIPQVDESIIDL